MSKGLNLGTGGINPQLGKYIEMPKVEKTKEEIIKRKVLPKDKQLVRSRKRRKAKKGPKLKPIVVTNEEQIKDLVHPIGEWIPYTEAKDLPLKDGDKFILCDTFYFHLIHGDYSEDFKVVFLGQLHCELIFSRSVVKVKHFFPFYLNKRYNKSPYNNPSIGFARLGAYKAYMPLPEPYKPDHDNSGWIPCDRYLPKHKERVLVSTETEEIHITYYNEYAKCFANNTKGEVIAWRPLPEPCED